MEESVGGRLKHAWNAFIGVQTDRLQSFGGDFATSFQAVRPYNSRLKVVSNKSFISSIYTRIAIDIAAISILHVRLDDNDRYKETIKSGLNSCLTLEANLDQTARALIQDAAMTLFDEGVVAIVPVDTTLDPRNTGSYDIQTMRVGRITKWHPQHVTVSLYDETDGKRKELKLSKRTVAIVENPLYTVMNEPNSTVQRLTHKLGLLDTVDEQSSSGKLDLIIQLPYVIKSDARRQQADQRRKDIEMQLKGSQYGIAYTDGTEKITQLNRPAENNLQSQVEYLTNMVYGQLGISKEVFDGIADEKVMLNYYNRTLEPVLSAITKEMSRKFLTRTARTQGQSIEFYRDPFKFVAIGDFAEIADKFTRNEITSSNEIRSVIGMKPSSDKKADELRNKNIPAESQPVPTPVAAE